MDNNIITNLKNSIINKVTSLVSSHNNNSAAHSDMRILLNAKIDKSSTEGLVKNDGSIDTNTYLTSQDLTNYEITTNKGSASSDKMGKFYIETVNNKTNIYYVKEDCNSRGHIYFDTNKNTNYQEIHGENLDTTKYYYYLKDDYGDWAIKGQLVHNGSGVWNITNNSQLLSNMYQYALLISDVDLEISNYDFTYVVDLNLDPSTYTIIDNDIFPYNDFYFGACGYVWHKLDDDILDELPIQVIYDESEIDGDGIYLEALPIAITGKVQTTSNINYATLNISYWVYEGDILVDWGDGSVESIDSSSGSNSHVYEEVGEYDVIIKGKIRELGQYCLPVGFTEVVLGDYITVLQAGCFNMTQTAITSIVLPNSITSIPDGCFYVQTGLVNVNIPSTVTSIGNGSFYNCSSLTSINIPSSVTSLGYACFQRCSSLTSISIPSSVTSLGNGCFQECSSLTSISIPSSVTSIGSNLCYKCTSLTDYQLYWIGNDIIRYDSNNLPNNTNTIYTIPNGETSNYVAKGYPSNKLVERSE